MTGGDAYKQKLLTDDALDAAISAYLADPSKLVLVEVGKDGIDVSAAVMAHAYAVEVLAREGATGPQKRNAVKTAVLLAPVGSFARIYKTHPNRRKGDEWVWCLTYPAVKGLRKHGRAATKTKPAAPASTPRRTALASRARATAAALAVLLV